MTDRVDWHERQECQLRGNLDAIEPRAAESHSSACQLHPYINQVVPPIEPYKTDLPMNKETDLLTSHQNV